MQNDESDEREMRGMNGSWILALKLEMRADTNEELHKKIDLIHNENAELKKVNHQENIFYDI